MSQRSFIAVAVCAIMVLSSLGALGFVASSAAASPTAVTPGSATIAQSSMSVPASTPASPAAPVAAPASAAPTVPVAAPTLDGQPLLTLANDPSYAQFVNNVNTIGANAIAAGLPRADLHMPYTGYIPSQYVNGVMESGNQITAQVPTLAASQTDPVGINYQGQNNTNGGIRYNTIRANSIEGILNVNASSANFYPDSGTPTQWGGQLNVVMPNVTIFGKSTYDFWLQNVISYDTNNQTISFVDDTWNFTSGS